MHKSITRTAPQPEAHTPGSWAVNPVLARVDAFVRGKAVPVCQLLWPTSVRTEAETESNGRLIAAAPDMLVALYECEEYLASLSDVVDGSYGIPEPNKAMSLLQEVREALTKAGQP